MDTEQIGAYEDLPRADSHRLIDFEQVDPRDLLPDLIVHEPSGPAAEVTTTVEARYDEETDFEFMLDGPSIPVEKLW